MWSEELVKFQCFSNSHLNSWEEEVIVLQGGKKHCTAEKCSQLESQPDTSLCS